MLVIDEEPVLDFDTTDDRVPLSLRDEEALCDGLLVEESDCRNDFVTFSEPEKIAENEGELVIDGDPVIDFDKPDDCVPPPLRDEEEEYDGLWVEERDARSDCVKFGEFEEEAENDEDSELRTLAEFEKDTLFDAETDADAE